MAWVGHHEWSAPEDHDKVSSVWPAIALESTATEARSVVFWTAHEVATDQWFLFSQESVVSDGGGAGSFGDVSKLATVGNKDYLISGVEITESGCYAVKVDYMPPGSA